MLDHVIVTGNAFYSFAEAGNFRRGRDYEQQKGRGSGLALSGDASWTATANGDAGTMWLDAKKEA